MRCGVRSVYHLLKGKGRSALRFESYRPIGVGHAIGRLADELWDYRNGPAARRFAGGAQVAGRMGALEAVAAHVMRVQSRLAAGLPTAVAYSDVRYGFDGGRHSLFCRKLWEAGATDWLWTSHSMSVERMAVTVGGRRLPDLSTDGVGTGQGKRQSPDIFAAGVSLSRDRTVAVADGAGVVHPPWAIRAFGSRWEDNAQPGGAVRRDWCADRALQVLAQEHSPHLQEEAELERAAKEAFDQCGGMEEAAALPERLGPDLDPIQQYLDDNALYAPTPTGILAVWRALVAAGDEAAFVHKCGGG